MTLDKLIETLEGIPPETIFADGFSYPHSYRGDYAQLAFEPASNVAAGEMLALAKSALNETFQGYKGGDYKMGGWVDVYLADYGGCGEAISSKFFEWQVKIAALESQLAEAKRQLSEVR